MAVINTNLNALVAQESSRASGLKLSQAMERLSTGTRINSAKDDAAGLAISNRMTSQIRGMAKATQNVNDAISMTQTAEGALGNISDVLQRMRELAVQSSTGTNSDSDRASIQLEVTQLQQQIQDMATKTNHNNIKLLDGSAQNVTIQSGVKAGDTLSLGFASMQTKDIGLGSRASLTSIGGAKTATTFAALSASSLYLNGVAVGASVAQDDNASPTTDAASSAIAKVAAINKVANLSGVYAKVDVNTVSGSAMTAASATGTVTINGVVTDTFATTTDTSLSRKNTVTAINAKSGITGVVAIDTGDDNLGIKLSAADGRNIVVSNITGVTSASTGLVAGTNVASFDLFTLDGRDITISDKTGTDQTVANMGLRTGTFKSDVAQSTSYLRTAQTAAPSSATTGLLNSNSMIINGVAIGQANATDDTASDVNATSSTRASSAIAIAAAINRSASQSGVTATAAPNVVRGSNFTALGGSASTGVVYLNGSSITVNNTTRNGVIDSFNAYSGQTGVVASAWGDGVQLTAADGRNIVIGSSAGADALGLTGVTIGTDGTAGDGAATYVSQVTLTSANKFTVQAGSNGVDNLQNLGFREGTFGGSDNGLKINQVDVSTAAGASQAITAIDAAINTVSAAQAKSGALNNRLDTIINNLAESSQNMSASKSRIMDTDYATETTNLAKQQIISQAATAMLAQANQQSQSVLSLLK
jgi:flagellin